MNDVLKDFSTPSLVAAIKANLFEWYDYLGRSPQAERYDSPELKWVLTGISHPFLNNVLRTQWNPDHVDARIEETLAHFKSRNVTRFSWWTEPGTQPANLGERLLAHGLTYSKGGAGMAVDLLALNEDAAFPSGLTVEAVGDEAALEQWVHPAFIGFGGRDSFGGGDADEKACFDLFAGLGFDMPLRHYVGWLDGKPVAASQLFLGAGVAGIYWVATVPEARHQGIGGALTLAPLREARAMGYRIGILQASSMGEGVYRGLGFQEYCRVSNYVLAGKMK
ncbi:MAG TPA: GNAT family N-acetyltransferase [Anaerolineales bacterium]|nr:GNAT family N-acetyltransferase [Anaerolineales bacterium]